MYYKIVVCGLIFLNVCGIVLSAAIPDVVGEDVANITKKEDTNDDQDGSESNFAGILKTAPPSATKRQPETAQLEQEGIPSRVLSVYDNTQSKVNDFLNPKPIVDTIQEHEKYGNTGDKFLPIGRALVNGYEGFSNILNRILDTPVEVAKQISRGITNSLNAVGGKLVGL